MHEPHGRLAILLDEPHMANRNPEVDRWLDEADHPLDATMRRAREIILAADDRVTESIKWKTPTFAFNGNIASFNPSRHVVSVMFHRGSEIPGDLGIHVTAAQLLGHAQPYPSTRWPRPCPCSRG